MSNKYLENQESAIFSVLKESTDHESMRKGLEALLKTELKGFTIREVMSKARHIVTQYNANLGQDQVPLTYHAKIYKSKTGTPPVRKQVYIKELCTLLKIQESDDLESLTKVTLMNLIESIKDLMD